MRKTTRCTMLALAGACLLMGPALAETYTVKLANGNSFETRYQPETAAWDDSKVILLSTVGNWFAVDKAEIAEVVVDTEVQGFGRVIDSTTVELGISANDQAVAGEEGADPQARMLQLLEAQAAAQGNQPVYNTQQFVDPSEATGIPVGYTQQVTPPLGGVPMPQPEPINP